MKIYTKTGDLGETGLFGGGRVKKTDVRVTSYGEIDELNSNLGWVRVGLMHPVLDQQLEQIQNELFDLGAELACVPEKIDKLPGKRVDEHDTQQLELAIDAMENDLAPLESFVLPGGSEHAARLHIARCVCRRAERAMLFSHQHRALRPETLRYINRLSDYLFVAARWVNRKEDMPDVLWQPRVVQPVSE